MYRKIIIHLFFIFLLCGLAVQANAATYYIAPDELPDGTKNPVTADGSGTLSSPFRKFNNIWGKLSKGDTLIMLDGIYYQSMTPSIDGAANPAVVDPVGSLNPLYPLDHPERTRNYITIKAQNDGKAVIDGQNNKITVGLGYPGNGGGNYFILEGFVARNSSESVYTLRSAHNVIIRRTSGYNASLYGNDHVYTINAGGTRQDPANILLEDNFASGGGRKMFMAYNSYVNVIFRRNAGYWTAHYGGGQYCGNDWPNGDNIEIYNWSQPDVPVNSIFENNIALGGTPTYGINMTPNPARTINNKLYGNISINAGRNYDGSPRYWSCKDWPATCAANAPFKKCAAADWSSSEWLVHRSGISIGVFSRPYMKNNIIEDNFAYGNSSAGFIAGDQSQGGTWCDGTEGNGNYPCALCNTTDNPLSLCPIDMSRPTPTGNPAPPFVLPGPSDRSSGNVLNRLTLVNNSIGDPPPSTGAGVEVREQSLDIFRKFGTLGTLYVEGDSRYADKSKGARLRYRYVNGELRDGTNGKPAEELWPWPMEDRIKAELAREFGIQNYSVTNKMVPLINQYTAVSVPLNVSVTPTPTGPTATPLPQPTATKTPVPPSPTASSRKEPCPQPGDTKRDGICDGLINIQDYTFLVVNFNNPAFDAGADLSADGTVNILDFSILSAHFGNISPTSTPISGGQAAGLVGYWNMNESVSGNGKTIADTSGNGITGTLNAGANASGMSCTVTGKSGTACQFDAVDDGISLSSSDLLHPSDALTIAAWVYPTGCGQFGTIVGHASWNSGYWLLTYNGCRVAANLEGVIGYQTFVTDQEVLTQNAWTHVAVTYNGSAATIYINGVLKKSLPATGNIKYSISDLLIGNATPDNYPFNGKIDEVRIYNRALSQTEIQIIQNQ